MTAQVAADLRAAAEVLRRDGWTQRGFHQRGEGGTWCHCAVGATEAATGLWVDGEYIDGHPGWVASGVAWRHLAQHLGVVGPVDVYNWNDAPGRTADEVIAALEAAADAAERKAAYDEGRWCGECQYGVVMDPPCCTQGPVQP